MSKDEVEERIRELEQENIGFKEKGKCHHCLRERNIWKCQKCGYWFCADCMKELYNTVLCNTCWFKKKKILKKMIREILEGDSKDDRN